MNMFSFVGGLLSYTLNDVCNEGKFFVLIFNL